MNQLIKSKFKNLIKIDLIDYSFLGNTREFRNEKSDLRVRLQLEDP